MCVIECMVYSIMPYQLLYNIIRLIQVYIIAKSIIWYQQFVLISLQITDLPFSLYSTFVIEARHGFNKVSIIYRNYIMIIYPIFINLLSVWFVLGNQITYYRCFNIVQQTIWLFFRDMIKGIVLSIVIGPPIVAAIIVIVQVLISQYFQIICFCPYVPVISSQRFCMLISFSLQKGGPYLAIYLWGFMFVLSLVMMTIYPVLIAPLFNKFTPVSIGQFNVIN